MIKGWKGLTKEELRHVSQDAGCHSEADWKRNMAFQNETNANTGRPACGKCWMIGKKLEEQSTAHAIDMLSDCTVFNPEGK